MAAIHIEDPVKRRIASVLERCLTAVGPALNRIVQMPAKGDAAQNPRTILLVRPDHIGDFILTLPAIAAVRKRYPEAHTIALVGPWSAELARMVPAIDEVVVVDCPWWSGVRSDRKNKIPEEIRIEKVVPALKARSIDLAIDFRGDLRHIYQFLWRTRSRCRVAYARTGGAAFLTDTLTYDPEGHVRDQAVALLRTIGIHDVPSGPLLREDAASSDRVQRLLADAFPDRPRFALVQPGARIELRAWPPERYAAVLAELHETQHICAVLVGDNADRARADAICSTLPSNVLNLVGRTSLPDVVSLASRAEFFLGSDSGLMHLACACDLPVVALFGPNHPRRCGPRGVPNRVARRDFACSPCLQRGCPLTSRAEGKCMQELSTRDVLASTRDLIVEIHGRR